MGWKFMFDLPDISQWASALAVLGFSAFFAFYIDPAIERARFKKK
jgi:hypothetical protein